MMRSSHSTLQLISPALGLQPPWEVVETLSEDRTVGQLQLTRDFARSSRFACPVHDTEVRPGCHLNFFSVGVSYRPSSAPGQAPQLGSENRSGAVGPPQSWIHPPVLSVYADLDARNVDSGGQWSRWPVLDHYVTEARNQRSLAPVAEFGVDGTAARRGHHDVTIVVDPGKYATTLTRFVEDFQAHHGDPTSVTDVTLDRSPAFIKGVTTHFLNAVLTSEQFQVMNLLGDGVDKVRREERKVRPDLAGTRYLWLKNPKISKGPPPIDSRLCAKPISKPGGLMPFKQQ